MVVFKAMALDEVTEESVKIGEGHGGLSLGSLMFRDKKLGENQYGK